MCRLTIHLKLRPGTNVAMLTALAHVIVTEGLLATRISLRTLRGQGVPGMAPFCRAAGAIRPRRCRRSPAFRPNRYAARHGCMRPAAMRAIYYGLGVTEHAQGSTTVMGIANLAMATGNIGREGVGVNPLRGQNNVQGSCDMGSFPHELPGYRHVSDSPPAHLFEQALGGRDPARTRTAHSQHVRCRAGRQLHGTVLPGRRYRAIRPEHPACHRRTVQRWNASWCRISS